MIFFDIDGVIRDVCTPVFGKQADKWEQKDSNGNGVIKAISENLDILVSAPTLEYLECVIPYMDYFLSHQPETWRVYTDEWIRRNIGESYVSKAIYVSHPDQKMEYIHNNDILVEDSPKLRDYKNVILVDRPYNKNINGRIIRVYDAKQLKYILNMVKTG
ncbi:MAG: hypothetical protein EPN88_13815 [Bacteroidetes bacterium]|nr:MAG: hypothetical protein EPN88_13815 [Bacteroidota bacterium]